jgi:RNA polymerase sigma factor (sigma-70 family)
VVKREPDVSGLPTHDVPTIRSFDAFFGVLRPRLVALAYAVSGNRAFAEDIVQDAGAVVFQDWERVSQLDAPEAWIKRIVINQSVSWRRRSASEARALLRLRPGLGEVSEIVLGVDSELIWSAVRNLSKQQAQAVALRYVDELTLEQIGEILGCSKETANTHLRRAHEKLARRLGMEMR